MSKIITVFGSSLPKQNEPEYQIARDLGEKLSLNGFSVKTGGYQGIMDAVSRGASLNKGNAIGVTVNNHWKASPSEFLTEEIKTNSLFERLEKLISNSAGFVILNGGTGTLVELALVWENINKGLIDKKPVVCLGNMWKDIVNEMEKRIKLEGRETDLILFANSVDETVSILLKETK